MTGDHRKLLAFLGPQLGDHGGNVWITPDLWALCAVETADQEASEIASWLLAGAALADPQSRRFLHRGSRYSR